MKRGDNDRATEFLRERKAQKSARTIEIEHH